jgi:hypothetical protein
LTEVALNIDVGGQAHSGACPVGLRANRGGGSVADVAVQRAARRGSDREQAAGDEQAAGEAVEQRVTGGYDNARASDTGDHQDSG